MRHGEHASSKMLSDTETEEMLHFLSHDTRADVKGRATGYILGLSGDREGLHFLRSRPDFLSAVVALTSDPSVAIAKDCYCTLINLSADETLHQVLLNGTDVLLLLLRNLLDPFFFFSDQICSILANLTRHKKSCSKVFKVIEEQEVGLARLVDIFCTEGYNKKANLHYLGPLLSNLTQLPETRHYILDRDRCVIQRLLPYTSYHASTTRRGGVIGTLRNCCFDYSSHEWLLGDQVDILPFLLLPLAGPEPLTEAENDGLPVDLQYLPDDKEREEDPDIRKMLLEALFLLTATPDGRQTMRNKNVYPIMREFHRWEAEPQVSAACEKLVQVLIGDEPERGMENLMEVNIPEEVEEKLKQADAEEEEEERRRKMEG